MQKPANPVAEAINNHAFELSSAQILGRIHKDAEWVLIGEASHGTKEFYETRACITKELFEKEGFNAVAVEAGVRPALLVLVCEPEQPASELVSHLPTIQFVLLT